MIRLLTILITLLLSVSTYSQKYIEPLSRGAVAVPCEKGNFISWRYLATDPEYITFDLLRDGEMIASGIRHTTCFTDTLGTSTSKYVLITRRNGTKYASKPLMVWDKPYISIPLDKPADGVAPNGKAYTYTPNDCSVADINGDGEYELLLKWDPSNSHDNSQDGNTGNVYLDCYKLHYGNTTQYTGKPIWRIDLGPNIRAGADDSNTGNQYSLENYKKFDNFINDLNECLMPWMEDNYSVATGRENTAVAGLSMGAREALFIGMTMPETFGYTGAFSPGYGVFAYTANGVSEDGMFTEETFTLPDEWKDITYIQIVNGISEGGESALGGTCSNVLKSHGVNHWFYTTPGAHDFQTWKNGLYNMAKNIFK